MFAAVADVSVEGLCPECPRLVFLDGSGDLIGAYRQWRSGRADLTQTDATFSGQVFEVARRGARVHAIAWPGGRERVEDGAFADRAPPPPPPRARGALFHLAQVLWAADIAALAARFRADAVIMQHGLHRWLSSPLRAVGVRLVVIVELHAVACRASTDARSRRALLHAEGWFFRRVADATPRGVARGERQVRTAAKAPPRGLAAVPAEARSAARSTLPPRSRATIRVLYAGRVEREKACWIWWASPLDSKPRVPATSSGRCGSGSADRELARAVEAARPRAMRRASRRAEADWDSS